MNMNNFRLNAKQIGGIVRNQSDAIGEIIASMHPRGASLLHVIQVSSLDTIEFPFLIGQEICHNETE